MPKFCDLTIAALVITRFVVSVDFFSPIFSLIWVWPILIHQSIFTNAQHLPTVVWEEEGSHMLPRGHVKPANKIFFELLLILHHRKTNYEEKIEAIHPFCPGCMVSFALLDSLLWSSVLFPGFIFITFRFWLYSSTRWDDNCIGKRNYIDVITWSFSKFKDLANFIILLYSLLSTATYGINCWFFFFTT